MKNTRFKTIYTICIFISLAAFEHIVIGLFPPLFSSISKDIGISIASMGLISGINILATALSAIYWGYLASKFNRKKLLIMGTIIWVVSVYLTSTSNTFYTLLAYQLITGIGLGCMASVGFSVLTDYVPFKHRGFILSLWGMAQGFGGIAGALLASVIAANFNWRAPFEVLSIIGIVLLLLYYFVDDPPMGNSEPELLNFRQKGKKYTYSLSKLDVLPLLVKGSNFYLFLQGFFMNIATGSLIWLPTFYAVKIQQQGIDEKVAIIAAAIFYGIFQLGGLTSSAFGHWGDRLQQKNHSARAKLTSIFVFLTFPLYVCMFLIPMSNFDLPNTTHTIPLLFHIGKEILFNPWILALFIISFFASASQSANTPNWLALITEVNLPEHRGLVFSIANLLNSLGRTLGNVGIAFLLGYMLTLTDEVNSYIWTLSILQLVLVPSALCYLLMAKKNAVDIKHVKTTLRTRADTTTY